MMTVNDLMEDVEFEEKIIMVDGKPKTIGEVLDQLLTKDKEPRQLSVGE